MNTSSWVQGSVNDELLVKIKKATAVSVAVPVLDDAVKEISVPRGIKKNRINTIDLREFKLHGHKLATTHTGVARCRTHSCPCMTQLCTAQCHAQWAGMMSGGGGVFLGTVTMSE